MPIFVRLHRAGITYSSRCLAGRYGCSKLRRSLRLGDDLIAVHRVDGGIAVSVKYNGRNSASGPAACSRKIGPALPHCCEGRRYVTRGATRQSRVDADGCIKVWVSRTHYCSCGTSSRQPGDIHAAGLDTEVAHNLASNAREERGLSLPRPSRNVTSLSGTFRGMSFHDWLPPTPQIRRGRLASLARTHTWSYSAPPHFGAFSLVLK